MRLLRLKGQVLRPQVKNGLAIYRIYATTTRNFICTWGFYTLFRHAFRQRKEGCIKKLEEQVRDYQILSENFKVVQHENYHLRDYTINLQSRLQEPQGEVHPPQSNVDGLQTGKASQPPQTNTLHKLSGLSAVKSHSHTFRQGVSYLYYPVSGINANNYYSIISGVPLNCSIPNLSKR